MNVSPLRAPRAPLAPLAPIGIGHLLAEVEEITADVSVNDKLKPLRSYLDQDGVLEVCVNRPGQVWVQTYGKGWSSHSEPALSFKHLQELATAVATYTGQHITERNPLLSASLPTGERLQVVQPSATAQGIIVLGMRKASQTVRTLDELDASGLFEHVHEHAHGLSESEQRLLHLRKERRYREFLQQAVIARQNIVVAGATGSGKTTFVKALAEEIPAHERLITIEDAAELTLPNRGNKVHLFYSKGKQGVSDISAETLLEACLRLKPDRIIQAELRGEEAFSFLDLAASGHPGSMTTLHAGSCDEAFERMALMVRKSRAGGGMTMSEINRMARSVIDVVVHFCCDNGRFAVTGIHYDPAGKQADKRGDA